MIVRADEPTSARLFEAWQQGDADAGNRLLCRFWDRIVDEARKRLGDGRLPDRRDLASELLDSVVGDLLSGLSGLEWRGEKAFIRLMVQRIEWKKLDHDAKERAAKRGGSRVEPQGGTEHQRLLNETPGSHRRPSEAARMDEDRVRLEAAKQKLPLRERRAVEAYYEGGMTLAEIGRLDLVVSTVTRRPGGGRGTRTGGLAPCEFTLLWWRVVSLGLSCGGPELRRPAASSAA